MSSCLKCGRCPGYSSQFYAKHKCVNCPCGLRHHRTFHRVGVYRLGAGVGEGSGSVAPSGGVSASPFVWARHRHRTRANVR